MPIRKILRGRVAEVKIWTEDVDEASIQQLRAIAALPFIHGHVAAMPDVHLGIGATIGSVVPTLGAIIPAAVGVDIGCGMAACRTNLRAAELPDQLSAVRLSIEARVPVGFDRHGPALESTEDEARHREAAGALYGRYRAIEKKHPGILEANRSQALTRDQLGTLGSGNHFIEICLDETGEVWIMLHSGSRQVGNRIGCYFIDRAKEYVASHGLADLPHRDLAYLSEGTSLFTDYVEAVSWAQDYARTNREIMMRLILRALRSHFPRIELAGESAVNCHHNYVTVERHFGEDVFITRKGAIRAREGDLGIIPGSMGAKSFIVRGKGNPDSLNSCSHGAGRRMSRREAKRRFGPKDLVDQTRGVECRKDKGVVDEIPSAYKPIDEVMANQSDLVSVVHTLEQVICVKG